MPTLLTGGNGWVPSHILRRLARRGESVISYDLMPPDDMLREFLGKLCKSVVFVQGDVTDGPHLRSVCERYGVDRIIHAAAITPREERERAESAQVIAVNLMSTVELLEIARTLPRFKRMVYLGSGASWGSGHTTETLDEESPSRATRLYGITKHTSERFCRRYKELHDLDIVTMRPGSALGPMERVTPGYSGATEPREILRIVAAGDPVLVNTLDGLYYDWTYVDDIAEGIERAWATPHLPHDVYTVTIGRLYSIGDVLKAFKRHWPGMEYRVVPIEEGNYIVPGGPPGPRPSNARMQADFGWVPTTSLDETVRLYLEWARANGPQ